MVLALVIPVLFDPHTHEAFDLPKYTVLVAGALIIAGLEVTGAVRTGHLPPLRPGIVALTVAWALWTTVSTFASVDVHLSLLGYRGSYDGLYTTLAFSVIVLSAAEAFDPADIPRVIGVLGIAAGSVVATYGLVQLHDFTFHGTPWDFVHWKAGVPNVFSTLGNPNHLGGYLAIVLPTCLLGATASSQKWIRRGLYLLCAVMVVLLLQSGTRGGWAATVAAAAVLTVGMWPEIRQRPRIPILAGATAVAGGIMLVTAAGTHFMGAKFSRLATFHSTASGRLDLWDAALHIGAAHPLTGTGPDTFVYVFPRYETAAWAEHLGFNYVSNGAHDIFMNVLADRGLVGLAILVAIIVYAAIIAGRTFWSLHAAERTTESVTSAVPCNGVSKVPAPERARVRGTARAVKEERAAARVWAGPVAGRMVLVAVAAGLTAYLVQDLFNTEQIALAFSWWLLLGCLLVLANASDASGKQAPSASSVLATSSRLQDRQTSSTPPSSTPPRNQISSTILDRRGLQSIRNKAGCDLPARRPKSRVRRHVMLACTCLAMTASVATLVYGADGPWRADHNYWAATTVQSLYPRAVRAGATETKLSALTRTFFADINRAAMLDPWEGTYPALAGDLLAAAGTAQHTGASGDTRRHDLVQAKSYLERAVRAVPVSSPYHYELAEVMVDLAPYEPGTSRAILEDAESQARLAVHWTPENHVYIRYLALIQSKLATVRGGYRG
jgi:O-antigen ligase